MRHRTNGDVVEKFGMAVLGGMTAKDFMPSQITGVGGSGKVLPRSLGWAGNVATRKGVQ